MNIGTLAHGHAAAVIWLDHSHALVAQERDGHADISEVPRGPEPELDYFDRVAHEAPDCDRLVILGPDPARIAFQREYVTLYERTDRMLDVGVAPVLRPEELLDQLRFIAFCPKALG